jgi:hypothetical protein
LHTLLDTGVDKNDISVVGKGEEAEPKDELELEIENKEIAQWGKLGAFFFWIPGFGQLVAAGPVIASLAEALGGAALVGSFTALTAWFIDLGIEEAEAKRLS